jgi:hypothetical protein
MNKLKSLLIIIIYLVVTILSVNAIYSGTLISYSLLVVAALILAFVAGVLKNKVC